MMQFNDLSSLVAVSKLVKFGCQICWIDFVARVCCQLVVVVVSVCDSEVVVAPAQVRGFKL